jgi:beta-galactosidase
VRTLLVRRALAVMGFIALSHAGAELPVAASTGDDGANAVPTQIPGHDAIVLGAAWYPEQWPEARWEADLQLMEDAHLQVVRVAEFSWSTMEPAEGKFELDWLGRAIALAAKHHIMVVLGTPTATPPAWLTSKYPDTLRTEENGQLATHGNRAQESVTSARYRMFCKRIVEQMVTRFGHDPNVVGWQIDNEYSYALMSYDADAKKQFQDWLKNKYGTLASLNQHWTTAYWSETYDNWNEIPIPSPGHNPGLLLDWKRFVTYAWVSYQQDQVDVIRAHADARQFITGNLMGWWDGLDQYKLMAPLTFASWDDYVGSGHVDPAHNGMTHDLMRGLKRENFWVMETQPGNVNWSPLNNALNKGEVRAMTWQAIAHGADDVNFWQWRSALNGQEEIHGTLVGPDGTALPLLEEVSQTGREFAQVQEAFRGTRPVSQVALLHSYESRWAIDWQKHTAKYDQIAVVKSYYAALRKLAQSVDIVSPEGPLEQYQLVVAPDLNLIPDKLSQHLAEYVQNGGHLVLGPRSGMKDEFNALLPQRQPGALTSTLGGRVEQYYALEKDVPVRGKWGEGTATLWAEQLKASAADVEVLMRYGSSNGWLDGQPAVITRKVGKGRITYIGAILDDKVLAEAAEWMTRTSGVHAVFGPVPESVEVSRRVAEGKQVFLLINFSQTAQHVALPHAMKSLLEGKLEGKDVEAVELPGYGVGVLLDGAGQR